MSTFTLAISCLTTSNLSWFVDLTFQVPMQYCSLQHRTLLPSPDQVLSFGQNKSESSRSRYRPEVFWSELVVYRCGLKQWAWLTLLSKQVEEGKLSEGWVLSVFRVWRDDRSQAEGAAKEQSRWKEGGKGVETKWGGWRVCCFLAADRSSSGNWGRGLGRWRHWTILTRTSECPCGSRLAESRDLEGLEMSNVDCSCSVFFYFLIYKRIHWRIPLNLLFLSYKYL